MQCCSVKIHVVSGSEDSHEVFLLKVGTSDAELADLLGDDWLLALDLEVELDVALLHSLYGLGARLLAGCFEISDKLLAVLDSNESKYKIATEVDDALALLL